MTAYEEYRLPLRIYIEDTDAGGIVFYANYLKYFERARTELVREAGVALRDGLADNISYVVHQLEVKYRQPARLDDLVVATAKVQKLGRSYLDFTQRVERENGECLVEATVRIACIALDTGKSRRLPLSLLSALQVK